MSEIASILKRSWKAHFWVNLATTAVLTFSFSLILGTILCSMNLARLLTVWGDEVQITVFLKDDITPEQQRRLEEAIRASEGVENVAFVDKQAAARSFEKSISSYGPGFMKSINTDGDNPFPASYLIRVAKRQKTPEKIEALAHGLSAIGGVEDVSYGQEWIKNYVTLVHATRIISIIFTIVILGACLFTVSNSIQASLSSRREEVEILELVGATSSTVRKPYLIEGAIGGGVSVFLALALLSILYRALLHALNEVMGSSSIISALSFLPLPTVFLALIIGTAVGAIGSYICVARINTGWSAAEGQA